MKKPMTILDKIKEEGITQVDTGYRLYSLEIVPSIDHNGHSCWGLTDFEKGSILLQKGMDNGLATEILLHELTHVVLELGGLGGGEEETDTVDGHTNEHITVQVSRGLLMLMRLNKRLFEIINGFC